MHTRQSAVDYLLKIKPTLPETKCSKVNASQRIQAIAIVRYNQLIMEEVPKTRAYADVAYYLHQTKGIWSYKARSIRGWSDHFLKTGNTAFVQSLSFGIISSEVS